ncbi:MAG TPA: uroporphyrinogen decarboxylase [Longimicrobiales bacterium]|nr:uroporphyrinogen decarboxylase [Longimicrobiales bacterium]
MNDRMLRALRGQPVDATPVWFMRQAGRSLPRYRELRADADMFELLRDPEAAAAITALPLEYFPVDALVLYNDISTPFFGAGLHVEIHPGLGPVVARPIERPEDVAALRRHDPRVTMDYIMDQIRLLAARERVPILGFVSAPFTLCTYLVKGARARNVEETKAFMWRWPDAWDRLAGFWADHLAEFAVAQAEAGAGAVQVFDSWAGALSPADYERFAMPYTRRILERLADERVPTIHFTTGNPALLPLVARAGGDAVGVDWRVPLDEAWATVGHERAIQGNLDPALFTAGEDAALHGAADVLARAAGRPGHIFNVGHGLTPGADPAVIRSVVDFVHESTAMTGMEGGV